MDKTILILMLSLISGIMIFGMIGIVMAENTCSADSDCVLKDKPYCCGDKIEYYKSCYYLNETPEEVNCSSNSPCPGIAQVDYCKCINNKCFGIGTTNSSVPVYTSDGKNNSSCKNLYWIDNDNKECSQKQFCGAYMYYGLQTFKTKEKCMRKLSSLSNKNYNSEEVMIMFKENVSEDSVNELLNKYNLDWKKDPRLMSTNQWFGVLKVPEGDEQKWINILNNESIVFSAEFNKKNFLFSDNNNYCDFEENGKCFKTLSNGRKAEIKIMPNTASQTAIDRLGNLGFNITLKEVGKNNETRIVYEIVGEKHGKFLGLFKTRWKIISEVDAETGEVVKIKKPWWVF